MIELAQFGDGRRRIDEARGHDVFDHQLARWGVAVGVEAGEGQRIASQPLWPARFCQAHWCLRHVDRTRDARIKRADYHYTAPHRLDAIGLRPEQDEVADLEGHLPLR